MYTIGQFSRICRITTKALRYYEKTGLLRPVKVDQATLYRYYTRDQVAQLEKIVHLKELGIPLKTVGVLTDPLTDQAEAATLLQDHRKFLQNQLELCKNKLEKLAWLQKTMEVVNLPETKKYNIQIKDLSEIPVRSQRKKLTSFYQELPALMVSVLDEITLKGVMCAGPPVVLYYDEEFNMDEVDVEAAWPVNDKSLVNNTLPAGEAATVMHVGPYNTLEKAYEALFEWINENGWRAVYPIREVYYNDPRNTSPDQLATEIMLQITRAK